MASRLLRPTNLAFANAIKKVQRMLLIDLCNFIKVKCVT